MRHPRLVEWERQLKRVFDGIDAELETKYGKRYPLHPSRAALGSTSNPEYNGLFHVGAAFTVGAGSEVGRGYIVKVRLATLAKVPAAVCQEIEAFVQESLERELPLAFPGRDLDVSRDGPVIKIHGDLSLGKA